MKTTFRCLMLIPVACALLALTACGNKGPLVMPQKPVPIEEQEVIPADEPVDGDEAPPADEPVPAAEPRRGGGGGRRRPPPPRR